MTNIKTNDKELVKNLYNQVKNMMFNIDNYDKFICNNLKKDINNYLYTYNSESGYIEFKKNNNKFIIEINKWYLFKYNAHGCINDEPCLSVVIIKNNNKIWELNVLSGIEYYDAYITDTLLPTFEKTKSKHISLLDNLKHIF